MFPQTTLSIYQTTAVTRKTTVRFLAVIRTSSSGTKLRKPIFVCLPDAIRILIVRTQEVPEVE
jgi:hypothetical protein